MFPLCNRLARHAPVVAVPLYLFGAVLLLSNARSAIAQQLMPPPNSLAEFNIPPSAANSTGYSPSSIRFGPNGQLYIWDGTSIYEQTAGLSSNAPVTIGGITSGSGPSPFGSDPGPINFSPNGQYIVVSEGAGGYDQSSNGLLFAIPIAGGTTVTPIGSDSETFDMIPLPASCKSTSSTGSFLLDVGTNYGSEVDLFNAATGAVTPIVAAVPGASTSITISGTNWSNYTLDVGVGYGGQSGDINSFSISGLFQSLKSGAAQQWSTGTVVDGQSDSNNSGAGMFVDPRGYLFTGGPSGIEVIGPSGGPVVYSIPYDTQGDLMGSPSVTYNSITNQFAVQGYDYSGIPLQQTVVFSASQFAVTALLAWTGGTNNTWDTTNTYNWSSSTASSNYYVDGNTVTFGDTDPNSSTGALVRNTKGLASVVIGSDGVAPAAVMFTNTGAANGGVDYTISGGPIGGSATIELYGNGTIGGTVTLTNANTFTGAVVVAAGTLNLQNPTALGNSSGASVIAGAALELQQSTGNQQTFGLTATGGSSIPLNLYGTGISGAAGELNSAQGNNIYGGAINVGSGGGQIVSSSTTGSDQVTLTGGVSVSTGSTLTVAGPGLTTLGGAGLTLGNSSTLQVASGTLQITLAAGSGTVSLGSGATVAIAPAATLQLAGSVSALSDPSSGNRAAIVNNGSAASGGGLVIAAGNQTVGTITGTASTSGPTTYTGDTIVAPGATLTAEQILQNTLSIGAGGTVTISPANTVTSTSQSSSADSSGEISFSLAGVLAATSESSAALNSDLPAADEPTSSASDPSGAIEQLEARVAILSQLSDNAATDSTGLEAMLSTAESSLLSLESQSGTSPTGIAESAGPYFSTDAGGAPMAVPEPATLVLLAIAGLCLPFVFQRRRVRGSVR
ncbi:MAG TPA: PEP-CTERM sorting domain-containing protein [Pirellulales bacterium]|jgi:autotransporter-associated beta strand protein|nr:PEP-CTERM sorting domain-containing protein [Pirellulales bacterium]